MKKQRENKPWSQKKILESLCPKSCRKRLIVLAVESGMLRKM